MYRNHTTVAERELTLNNDVGLASRLLADCPERLRGWEWEYLMRLRDGPRPPLAGHTKGLWTAVYNKDGTRIATASIDGTAKIWDAKTGKILLNYTGHIIPLVTPPIPITCLSYSPDGRSIASASLFPDLRDLRNPRKAFGVVKIWNPETGSGRVEYNKQIGLVYCLAYSPDGSRIASSHINDEKIVAIWDSRTGKEIHLIRDNASHVHGLRFSPDGRLLVAGCTDGTVKMWNAETFKLVRIIKAHAGPVVQRGLLAARRRSIRHRQHRRHGDRVGDRDGHSGAEASRAHRGPRSVSRSARTASRSLPPDTTTPCGSGMPILEKRS